MEILAALIGHGDLGLFGGAHPCYSSGSCRRALQNVSMKKPFFSKKKRNRFRGAIQLWLVIGALRRSRGRQPQWKSGAPRLSAEGLNNGDYEQR
jgi:hypothetical protein